MFSVLCHILLQWDYFVLNFQNFFSISRVFFFTYFSLFSSFFCIFQVSLYYSYNDWVRTTLANENKKKLKPNNGRTRTNCELQRLWQDHVLKFSLVERGKISVLHVQLALKSNSTICHLRNNNVKLPQLRFCMTTTWANSKESLFSGVLCSPVLADFANIASLNWQGGTIVKWSKLRKCLFSSEVVIAEDSLKAVWRQRELSTGNCVFA